MVDTLGNLVPSSPKKLYCGTEQSTSDRKAELAPYGITQCICSSCINATPETDTIHETYRSRLEEYKRQSMIWDRSGLGSVPRGTIDELLRYHAWGYCS